MSKSTKIESYAKQINGSWRKTTDSILETAELCAEAVDKLSKDDKTKLVEQLDFSAATFSKLAKIGQEPRLQEEKVKALLPPNYSIVYEVAKLSSGELDAAISDQVISPTMSRADLEAWLTKRFGVEEAPVSEDKPRVIATVRVPPTFTRAQQAKLEAALERLQEEFDFDLARSRDADQEALSRTMRQVDDYIRKGARAYIRSLKKHRLAAGAKLSASERKQLWAFTDEEIKISETASWPDIQRVLDHVGSGDQFDRL